MSFRPVTVAVMVWVSIAVISCARETGTESNSAYLSGTITVADSLDSSRNFEEIELISLIQQGNGETDKIFYAVTDSLGRFSGKAQFEENDFYNILIIRYQNNINLLYLDFAD